MEKNTIKINESQLKKIISGAIKESLDEVSWTPVHNAEDKTSNVDFDEIYDALRIIQRGLNVYDSEVFYDKRSDYYGMQPKAANLSNTLNEFWKFFKRKEKQMYNFQHNRDYGKEQTEDYIVNFAKELGYDVTDFQSVLDLDSSENPEDWNKFRKLYKLLPDNYQYYIDYQ